jgi:signal transduction histidine kinase
VRRTLRPVHLITRRTRSITDANLSERVPVPESRDDIAELATTMNAMLARLDHAQRRQREFVADASHELRSPIAASVTQLEVALAHPTGSSWEATAAAVLDEQTQLGHLVDDLLALSQLDEQGVGAIAPLDLCELVVDELARPHPRPIDATIAARVLVEGNRAHLTRAIRNVVDNACDHAASAVGVSVSYVGDRPTIQVDDDGPGIPAEQRSRVFDRFARLDEPRSRNNGGAGLGLAIVREVVVAHGGAVTCTDSPAGGARITLDFPPTTTSPETLA